MSEASDLEYLDAAAQYVRQAGADEALTLGSRSDIGRGVALVDAALVRVLHRWRPMDDGSIVLCQDKIAPKMMPKVAHEARRRLGR